MLSARIIRDHRYTTWSMVVGYNGRVIAGAVASKFKILFAEHMMLKELKYIDLELSSIAAIYNHTS